MDHNEQNLIAICQRGDKEAFGILYDKYVKKIYNFIYYKTYHKETAEDITSIVFTKALENIKNFDIEKGFFSAWLYKIARNSLIDHYRKYRNESNIDDILDLSSPHDLKKEVERSLGLGKIEAYLKNLSSIQRDIIRLRIWEDMSYKEISQILDKTEDSCKMAFSRAIKKLRDDMPLVLLLLLLLYF